VAENWRVVYDVVVHDGVEYVYIGRHKTFDEAHNAALEAWGKSIRGNGAYINIRLVVVERDGRAS